MTSIFKHALALYDEGGTESMWTYLDMLIRSGAIEEGTAEQIAYMVEEG